jgi:hypothetical protein
MTKKLIDHCKEVVIAISISDVNSGIRCLLADDFEVTNW